MSFPRAQAAFPSEDILQISRGYASRRFTALLRPPNGRQAEYNQPLLERADWVFAPTLGPIVPNWLIAVPRAVSINLRAWKSTPDKAPQAIINDLCEHLGITVSDLVWFEHGPASTRAYPVVTHTHYI